MKPPALAAMLQVQQTPLLKTHLKGSLILEPVFCIAAPHFLHRAKSWQFALCSMQQEPSQTRSFCAAAAAAAPPFLHMYYNPRRRGPLPITHCQGRTNVSLQSQRAQLRWFTIRAQGSYRVPTGKATGKSSCLLWMGV